MGTSTLSQIDARGEHRIRPGVIVPLYRELTSLTKALPASGDGARQRQGGMLVMVSGIGPVRARAAGERLLAAGATALVSWGSAGALLDALRPGCLVLPRHVFDADKTVFPVDRRWHARLYELLSQSMAITTKPICQTSRVLTHPRQKRLVAERHKAVAADMESAALAEVAARHGVPFIAIRAIVDTAAMELPLSASDAIDACGRLRLGHFLIHAAMRPRDWRMLWLLGKNFKAACNTLTLVALHAGDTLGAPPRIVDRRWG